MYRCSGGMQDKKGRWAQAGRAATPTGTLQQLQPRVLLMQGSRTGHEWRRSRCGGGSAQGQWGQCPLAARERNHRASRGGGSAFYWRGALQNDRHADTDLPARGLHHRVRASPAQPSAAQHSAAQHSTVQHSTVKRSPVLALCWTRRGRRAGEVLALKSRALGECRSGQHGIQQRGIAHRAGA